MPRSTIENREIPNPTRIVVASIAFIGYDDANCLVPVNRVGTYYATNESNTVIEQWFLQRALQYFKLGNECAEQIFIEIQSIKPSKTKNRKTRDFAVSIVAMSGPEILRQHVEVVMDDNAADVEANTFQEYRSKWSNCRNLSVVAGQIAS